MYIAGNKVDFLWSCDECYAERSYEQVEAGRRSSYFFFSLQMSLRSTERFGRKRVLYASPSSRSMQTRLWKHEHTCSIDTHHKRYEREGGHFRLLHFELIFLFLKRKSVSQPSLLWGTPSHTHQFLPKPTLKPDYIHYKGLSKTVPNEKKLFSRTVGGLGVSAFSGFWQVYCI